MPNSSDVQPAHATDTTTGKNIIAKGSKDSLANPAYTSEPLTDFEGITPETDLDSLNLNWRERDLPESKRTKHVHRLHPYLGKYIPQIVEIFLRKFTPRVVVDPFAGSGTTLVETATLGISGFGVDVSPFNCLLAKVKTDEYDLELLSREVHDILRLSQAQNLSLFPHISGPKPLDLTPNEYIRAWFAPRAQEELLRYCGLIPNYEYSDVLKVILSRAARSARLVPHHELDFPKEPQAEPYYCRKHRRICSPVQEAGKFLVRYSKDTLKRIVRFAQIRQPATTVVVCRDSRDVDFPPADLVITSPPYVGLIDYHQQHRYAYELLGLLPQPFASLGYVKQDPLLNEEREIGPASKGTSQDARAQYIQGIRAVFQRVIQPMPVGGHIVIVVNDKSNLYAGMTEALPVEHVTTLNRHVNRRTGRRTGAFYEQILISQRV